MSTATVTVVLAPHEREGMRQLVMITRATAKVLNKDERIVARMLVHAQAVEDVLSRLDTAR